MLSHPRSSCSSFPQEVHLKYTSRDGLLAALNLFQAATLQSERQLSNSLGTEGFWDLRDSLDLLREVELKPEPSLERRSDQPSQYFTAFLVL